MQSSGSILALVLLTLPLILGGLLFLLAKKNRKLRADFSRVDGEYQAQKTAFAERSSQFEQLKESASRLEAENARLGKFSGVADAEAEALRIKTEITAEAEKIRAESLLILSESQRRVFQETREAREHAQKLIEGATSKSKDIVDQANVRAREIAGEAIEVKDDARKFEKIAQAMKNKIEGYGNLYLVPTSSILDELAEAFGFAEAGQKLKDAREVTRKMVKDRVAATCEYVEANRRETAVDFVVDAFNGKCDSILSRAKHDNAGTLEQQIRDAFTLVNHNGRAFRSAEITEDFLRARLAELKWAAVAQELKLRDQEEQRRIREQIREEEKARKEYERAIRDAEKEEDALKKAIEKVRKETEKASEETRQSFEDKLAELSLKLKEAEEKNQRAVSMAQQTKVGHVYVISNIGSFGDDVIKIGMTRRLDPNERVKELGDASVPFSFDVHAMIYSEDAPALERALHSHFLRTQVNKANPRKEFFRLDISLLKSEVERLGIQTSWTIAAQAREYRETVALEQAMEADPSAYDAWAASQGRSRLPVFDRDGDEEDTSEEAGSSKSNSTKKRAPKAA